MKLMKKNKFKLLGFLILFIIITSCSSNYIERNKEIGNLIIEKVENFKKVSGYPPNRLYIGLESDFLDIQIDSSSVSEYEIAEAGTSVLEINGEVFCYQRLDSINYMVWFGTTLGEGIYYYSDTKKWEDRLREIGK
jgi:hypothetical protein